MAVIVYKHCGHTKKAIKIFIKEFGIYEILRRFLAQQKRL